MNPLEQINGYKGGIVSLPQLIKSLEEPVGFLSWCYYIISFSFWQTIIRIDFWSIAPFLKNCQFPTFMDLGLSPSYHCSFK